MRKVMSWFGSQLALLSGRRGVLALGFALALTGTAFAQPKAPEVVKWSAAAVQQDARAGEAVMVGVSAKIQQGWHIYDLKKAGEWTQTVIGLKEGGSIRQSGEAIQPDPQTKFDAGFKTDIAYFEGGIKVGVPATIDPAATGNASGTVKISYQACDAKSCLPPTDIEVPVSVPLAQGAARPDHQAVGLVAPDQPSDYIKPSLAKPTENASSAKPVDNQTEQINAAKKQGLLPFILLSVGAGLLALLTPCVWPMVPVTVSYFAKRSSASGWSTLQGALWYCAGIMGTFVALGLVTSVVFGAANIHVFAANPWVNLGLGVLFVALAANLFGVYELVVPANLVGKAQAGTKAAGIVGPLLMGLVFSLTSFT
ncbi:MAG: cytochrome c biogenesis protein CcdA [bacterium]